jgi:hypothetical protein
VKRFHSPIFMGLMGVLAVASSGCEDHTFFRVDPICARQVVEKQGLSRTRPVDILFVVDDSFSMADERDRLAQNIVARPGCDIANNPDDKNCGFMEQLVAAASSQNLDEGEEYFRIGLITTSLGQAGSATPFGCLFAGDRPDVPYISSDHGPDAVGLMRDRINAITDRIAPGGGGAPGDDMEQGLEAMKLLLEGESDVASCRVHAQNFLRTDAKLVVVFVTDEDDCSHVGLVSLPSSACYQDSFPKLPVSRYTDFLKGLKPNGADDLAVAVIAGAVFDPDPGAPDHRSVACAGTSDCEPGDVCKRRRCVADEDCPVDSPCVSSTDEPGTRYCTPQNSGAAVGFCASAMPAACNSDPAGTNLPTQDSIDPENSADRCFATGGGPGTNCPEDTATCRPCFGGNPQGSHPFCCQVERGNRYFELARELAAGDAATHLMDSICLEDFRQTLQDIASLLILVPRIELLEPPSDPTQMRVTLSRRQSDGSFVDEVLAVYDPDNGVVDGWNLGCDRACDDLCQAEGPCAMRWLQFFGQARPRPGDKVDIKYLTEPAQEVCGGVTGRSPIAGGG